MTPQQFKQARLKLGLSQVKLAKELKVCRFTIIGYELGRIRIMPKKIDRLVNLLEQSSEQKRKKEIELEYLLKN